MIQHVDAALRDLVKALLSETECDVSFAAPALEWSSGRDGGTSTINMYLYDIIENLGLQTNAWDIRRNTDRTVTQVRPPAMLDLYYLLSTWRFDAEDREFAEHELLGTIVSRLLALHLIPEQFLPEDFVAGLPDARPQIPLRLELSPSLAGSGTARLWRSLNQGQRPAISLKVTVPVDLHQQITDSLVVSRTIRYPGLGEERSQIAGTVESSGDDPQSIIGAEVLIYNGGGTLVSRTATDDNGRFTFRGLQGGGYTVDVKAGGFTGRRVKLERLGLAGRGDLTIHLKKRGG
jgi:hypothetical protein